MELRIAAALELGPVEVTEAIFRLSWTDGSPIAAFELRGEAGRVEVSFSREPFDAERVDLSGETLGGLTVTGTGFDVAIGPGRLEIVRARLAP